MPEPRYLMGDEYALTGGYEELINCLVCSKEYDRVEYRSNTCSDCEDEMIKREGESVSKECDCDNLDQDVSGYTCYKCYEKGK